MDTINPQHLADFLEASRRFFGLVGRVKRRKLLALFTATVPVPAFAQYGGRRGFGRSSSDSSKAGKREQTPALETTLHELSEDLKLTPAQQPLFDAYADKVRALRADMIREREHKNASTLAQDGVLVRIDRAVDIQRDRLTAVEDIAHAAKNLFAKLDAGQQRIADPRLATVMLIPFG